MRAILTYHSIDPSGSVISVDPSLFRQQMQWLAESRVRVVPLDEISRVAGRAVALTFDDGFRNFADEALPVLEDLGFPSTIFVVTAKAGETNDWRGAGGGPVVPELPLLDWAALSRVADKGVVIGSHGRLHLDLSVSSRTEVTDEIAGSALDLSRNLGGRPSAFAYPFGAWTSEAAALVSEHYEASCTTELRTTDSTRGPHLLPRLDMYYFRDLTRFKSFGTGSFERYVLARRLARNIRLALLRRPRA
jgi:peptidoglycan/xylan/chitin deacetylase (PgdA/CDA1 family)